MHNDTLIIKTITTVALQLDEIEIPTMTPRAIFVRESADPDGAGLVGAARGRSRGVIALGVTGRGILGDEEVAEEGFEEGRTATDETGVDFDDAFRGTT